MPALTSRPQKITFAELRAQGVHGLLPADDAHDRPPGLPAFGLVPTTQAEWEGLLEEYRLGMRELGYIEGQTVETEYLYADGLGGLSSAETRGTGWSPMCPQAPAASRFQIGNFIDYREIVRSEYWVVAPPFRPLAVGIFRG